MTDEIDAIGPVSRKRKLQASFEQTQIPVYTGSYLPHHFASLVLEGAKEVFDTISENTHRNLLEMREWRIEDEKSDVWRRLEKKRDHINSFLKRQVVFIPSS